MPESEKRRLNGHIAMISGAGGDIGRAIATVYASAGAELILIDNRQDQLERTDDNVRTFSTKAALVALDLTDCEKVAGLGCALFERFGRVDSVTACHGARATPTPLGHITSKEWERVTTNNITAMWQLIQMSTPLLNFADSGRFLALTCSAAVETPAFNASYNVAKAGVEALVRTFQAETENTFTCVTLVDPGELLTQTRRAAYPYQVAGEAPEPDAIAPHFVDLLLVEAGSLAPRIEL